MPTSHDLTSERVGLTVFDSSTSFLEDGLPGRTIPWLITMVRSLLSPLSN